MNFVGDCSVLFWGLCPWKKQEEKIRTKIHTKIHIRIWGGHERGSAAVCDPNPPRPFARSRKNVRKFFVHVFRRIQSRVPTRWSCKPNQRTLRNLDAQIASDFESNPLATCNRSDLKSLRFQWRFLPSLSRGNLNRALLLGF